ncbi:hypothetical protein SAMN04515671_1375 [Nakamurella panacisegetis]|uniref:Meiotically up-regulated gene 113 n=1 Tax=Nakamurella panacisegetis TaxID=1090615 RepID=A0A1H0KN44_9ACTN|nr:hypothetical protein [Nakamurella panacisegetis]SDO57295.1 hypothetical protein SAMN04515671_1375 [Nakamurella panacisegetis]
MISTPAKTFEEPYLARCRRCGASRRVSASTLSGGGPPCLACDGLHFDASDPHRVYLFHFAEFGVFKTGITNAGGDSRLRAHAARGGRLLEIITVRDRAAAHQIEQTVLKQFRAWPGGMTEEQFPQIGWTECWDERGGRARLAATAVAHYFARVDRAGLPA